MNSALLLVTSLFLATDDQPEIYFTKYQDDVAHIRLVPFSSTMHVWFRLEVKGQKGNKLFIRVRAADKRNDSTHLHRKEITLEKKREVWSFFLEVPNLGTDEHRVTYQIEAGFVDPEQLNEEVVIRTFAWRMKAGEIDVGTRDDPIFVTITRRLITKTSEGYMISVAYARAANPDVTYAILDVDSFSNPPQGLKREFAED